MGEGTGRCPGGEQGRPQRMLLVRLGLHPVVSHLAEPAGVRVDGQVGLHGHRQPHVQLQPARREQVLVHDLARYVVPEAVGALVGVRNQEVGRQRLVQRFSERAGRQVRSLGEDPVPQRPGCYGDQSDDELRVLRQRAEPQPHHVANPVRDAPGHTVLLGRCQLLDQERQAGTTGQQPTHGRSTLSSIPSRPTRSVTCSPVNGVTVTSSSAARLSSSKALRRPGSSGSSSPR